MKDHLIVERTAVQRMRMADQSGVTGTFSPLVKQGFEASRRPFEKE
jgi:hypothetical protein